MKPFAALRRQVERFRRGWRRARIQRRRARERRLVRESEDVIALAPRRDRVLLPADDGGPKHKPTA